MHKMNFTQMSPCVDHHYYYQISINFDQHYYPSSSSSSASVSLKDYTKMLQSKAINIAMANAWLHGYMFNFHE